jgi:hypothetical protein
MVARDPLMGTIIQVTPVSATTFACRTYLGSSRLIAVSVTIVLIRSRAMIARNASGLCQAPRIKRPGSTTRKFFSLIGFQRTPTSPAAAIASAITPPSRRATGRLNGLDLPGHSKRDDVLADLVGANSSRRTGCDNPKITVTTPTSEILGAGKPFHVINETPGVSKRPAMAETDQLRFELSQPLGRSAVLRRIEAENPLRFAKDYPFVIDAEVRQDIAEYQHTVLFAPKRDVTGGMPWRLDHGERSNPLSFS